MVLAKVVTVAFVVAFAVLTALSVWNFVQDSPLLSGFTRLLLAATIALIGLFAAWRARSSK